jgi:hypothetical protein
MTFQFRTFCVGISSFSPDRERSNGLVGQRGVRKSENNPMKQDLEKHSGSKERDGLCKAKTRSGSTCGRPPIRGRARCRLHGGLSPGAPLLANSVSVPRFQQFATHITSQLGTN